MVFRKRNSVNKQMLSPKYNFNQAFGFFQWRRGWGGSEQKSWDNSEYLTTFSTASKTAHKYPPNCPTSFKPIHKSQKHFFQCPVFQATYKFVKI